MRHRTQWHSERHIMRKCNSSESWRGSRSNRRNPKYQLACCWHETRSSPSQTCCHLTPLNGLQLPSTHGSWVSIWTSSWCVCVCVCVWIERQCPCGRVPTSHFFANGSSLRDLRSRDTGQLEKGKHKSPEPSTERFMVYRGAIFEIESLIRKCWWSDPVEDSVTWAMSGSFRCRLTAGLITSPHGPWSSTCDRRVLFVCSLLCFWH